jgi:glycosyltransferase involved in cell wall biosynthesis
VRRAIPSVLAGAYQNVEIVVCSDGPQPEARAAVEAVADHRVRYVELEQRPAYPTRPEAFWQVAGAYAVNRALDEAQGALIAPLDHDDAFTHDHIPTLLEALRASQGDFVYGQAMTEYPDGDWRLLGSAPLAYGEIVHASVMYTSRLGHLRYDPDAWLVEEPGDWNLWRRMRECGTAAVHLPVPVAVHFKERSSIDHRQRGDDVSTTELMAHDVVATSARALLTVLPRGG